MIFEARTVRVIIDQPVGSGNSCFIPIATSRVKGSALFNTRNRTKAANGEWSLILHHVIIHLFAV